MKYMSVVLDPLDLLQRARLECLRGEENIIVATLAWKVLLNAELYLITGNRSALPVPEVIYAGGGE